MHNKDGRRLLCQAVKIKKRELDVVGRIPWVKVVQTMDSKGSKVTKKGDKLPILVGTLVVLGPKESRVIVSAFRV